MQLQITVNTQYDHWRPRLILVSQAYIDNNMNIKASNNT